MFRLRESKKIANTLAAMYQPRMIKRRLMIQMTLGVAIATPNVLDSCINS